MPPQMLVIVALMRVVGWYIDANGSTAEVRSMVISAVEYGYSCRVTELTIAQCRDSINAVMDEADRKRK